MVQFIGKNVRFGWTWRHIDTSERQACEAGIKVQEIGCRQFKRFKRPLGHIGHYLPECYDEHADDKQARHEPIAADPAVSAVLGHDHLRMLKDVYAQFNILL